MAKIRASALRPVYPRTSGIWAEAYWKSHSDIAKNIIAANRLRPVSIRIEVEGKAVATNIKGGPLAGIPALHLHCSGKTYLVTKEQWREFSTRSMEMITERLSGISGVQDAQDLVAIHSFTVKG